MERGKGSTRTLGVHLRADLVIRKQVADNRSSWVVKDPITLRYFVFRAEEFAILQMLDGEHDAQQVCREFNRQFAPQRLTPERLHGFLANLYRQGLVASGGENQGKQLLETQERQQRRERWQRWSSLLAIRFPSVDPDPVLAWLYPKLRWLFGPVFLACCVMLAVAAVMLLFIEADEFRDQMPALRDFLHARNLVWLAAALAVTKVLHEFGHALACKHFGGECHELGFMLLIFTPCLYCNVTDSWMLCSRWKRIAISAAGIVVEVVLASLAAFGWWLSEPGLLHTICLNVIVVCSVGTVLLNGNPLLRYDGYFILSDLLYVPNLWQESRDVVHRNLARGLLGVELGQAPWSDDRAAVKALYGVLSMAYRCVVVVGIFMFLYHVLRPWGLQIILAAIAATMVAGVVVQAAPLVRRLRHDAQAVGPMAKWRTLLTGCGLAGAAWLFAMVPFPCNIAAPAMLEPAGAQRVYVSTPGVLLSAATDGQRVTSGKTLARLTAPELERQIIELTGESRRLEVRAHSLSANVAADDTAAADLLVTKERLADVQQQLHQRQREKELLTLRTAVDGTVFAPKSIPSQTDQQQELPFWSTTPLEECNVGCFLERGTLLCLVAQPGRYEAVLYVDDSDIQFIHASQRVRLLLDVAPGEVLTGTVSEIAQEVTKDVPTELATGQRVANRRDAAGQTRPLGASYQVRVALDEHDVPLVTGGVGRAKIRVAPQTAAERCWHALRQTFRALDRVDS